MIRVLLVDDQELVRTGLRGILRIPFGFEVVGNRVLVAGPKVSPAEVLQVIGTAKGFVDHVPEVVFSLYPVSG